MTDTQELVKRLNGAPEGAYLVGVAGDIKASHLRQAADTIERLQRELSELQQYGVVVPVNPTAEIRDAMSSAYDRRLQFIDRWDRVYNAALNGAIDAARKGP